LSFYEGADLSKGKNTLMSFTKGAFFNNANSFKHTAVLKGMLHVNNTTYIHIL